MACFSEFCLLVFIHCSDLNIDISLYKSGRSVCDIIGYDDWIIWNVYLFKMCCF